MTHLPPPPPGLAAYPWSLGRGLALALGRLLPRRSLDAGALIDRAERRVGSADWGSDGVAGDGAAGDLSVLLDSVARDVPLTRLGQAILRETVEDGLGLRLRIRVEAARRPELAGRPLRPPIVITGLHRTGTTFLHRLLCLDPAATWLPAWLTFYPLPLPSPSRLDAERRRRIRGTRLRVALYHLISPAARVIHPLGAGLPEEESVFFRAAFRSYYWHARFPVLGHLRWIDAQDHGGDYRLLRTLLLLVQSILPGERWVLKAPMHLEALDALLETFPEASVVQVHRDPVRAVPSFISMVESLYALGVADPRRSEWIEALVGRCERAVRHGAEVRRAGGERRILDVHFQDLIGDPVAVVAGIYRRFGLPLSDLFRRRMEAFLAARSRRRPPRRHRYSPAQYGLDVEILRARFRGYVERYGVAAE